MLDSLYGAKTAKHSSSPLGKIIEKLASVTQGKIIARSVITAHTFVMVDVRFERCYVKVY